MLNGAIKDFCFACEADGKIDLYTVLFITDA